MSLVCRNPFGYGLSYTTFHYSNLKTSSPKLARDGSVMVSVDVTNTGERNGDEVVQLYVSHPKSTIERPRQELKGFQRVSLKPRETMTNQIPLKATTLAYWNEKQRQFKVEADSFNVTVGGSSADVRQVTTLTVQ